MHRDCYGLRKKRDDEFDFNIGAKIAFERLNTMRNPHIMYGSMDYGEIGKPTKIKDFKGRNLFVGSVIYANTKRFVTTTTKVIFVVLRGRSNRWKNL